MFFPDYMDKLDGFYLGTIEETIYPEDPRNTTKYQIQYIVNLTIESYSQTRVLCIVQDRFGGLDDFEDITLRAGIMVFVQFPRGDPSIGVITGCPRRYTKNQSLANGRYWKKRFNKITQSVDQQTNWKVEHDLGNYITITPTQIIIDDGKLNKFTIDQTGKITVDSGDLEINVKKNANITIVGDCTIKAKKVDLTAKDVNVTCKKLDATVAGDASITAAKEVSITGSQIKLNGEIGDVLTTASQPTCYVTGIPFMGSQTVKAGL
jgi:hypothetical protein